MTYTVSVMHGLLDTSKVIVVVPAPDPVMQVFAVSWHSAEPAANLQPGALAIVMVTVFGNAFAGVEMAVRVPPVGRAQTFELEQWTGVADVNPGGFAQVLAPLSGSSKLGAGVAVGVQLVRVTGGRGGRRAGE